jgi:uncharacterized protein (TIGR00290 family)
MEAKNILHFWSGGKDSNLSLTRLRSNPEYKVMGLVTLIDRATNAVRYHGICEALVVDQAKLLDLPLIRIYLDKNTSNEDYLKIISERLIPFSKKNLHAISFGDIHLDDVKHFKEALADKIGVKAIFPLWNESSEVLLNEYFLGNHQALISAIDKAKLDISFLGKMFDREWIAKLPAGIDSMGENGEFHSFATFSPYFKKRIAYSKAIAIEDGPYTISTLKEP